MKLLILGSGELLLNLIDELGKYSEIDLIGVCNLSYRKTVTDWTQRELEGKRIRTFDLSLEIIKKADMVLSFNCSVILPGEIVNEIDIINVHVGILPKYRGNSANTWAIMNGEKHIGFTIHKMVEMLDAGDIYHVEKIPIDKNSTYSDVYDELMTSIIEKTPVVILGIHKGNIHPKIQDGAFIYCTMFSKEMGNIRDFHVKSVYIHNLFRCMARPHGSGIYFFKNHEMYETRKVLLGKDCGVCDYVGIPGKIVNIYDNMLWIKTEDNVVIFGDIVDVYGNSTDVASVFKNGQKLDMDMKEKFYTRDVLRRD